MKVRTGNNWRDSTPWARGPSQWDECARVWAFKDGIWQITYQRVRTIFVNSETKNFNLRTEYENQFGAPPSGPLIIRCEIYSIIGSTSTSAFAFDTGSWGAGAKCELLTGMFSGVIVGAGGKGGDGDADTALGPTGAEGEDGGTGGNALKLRLPTDIYCDGVIGSGGGGGGGSSYTGVAGGGGGGAGDTPGGGGVPGGSTSEDGTGKVGFLNFGGSGGWPDFDYFGGDGGDMGQPGNDGSSAGSNYPPGKGGQPGIAIDGMQHANIIRGDDNILGFREGNWVS